MIGDFRCCVNATDLSYLACKKTKFGSVITLNRIPNVKSQSVGLRDIRWRYAPMTFRVVSEVWWVSVVNFRRGENLTLGKKLNPTPHGTYDIFELDEDN